MGVWREPNKLTVNLKHYTHSLETVGERLHGAMGESGAMLLPQTASKQSSVFTLLLMTRILYLERLSLSSLDLVHGSQIVAMVSFLRTTFSIKSKSLYTAQHLSHTKSIAE